jgi:Bacterial Ig-like domain (group 3)
MIRILRVAIVCVSAYVSSVASAADTTSYSYDALGRLKKLEYTGGPANGAQIQYLYDAAGNRTQYIVSGSTSSGGLTIAPFGSRANQTSTGVVLGVHVSGSSSPGGTVVFTENGTFLGSTVVQSGDASIILEGFAVGTHAITVSYAGDANNPPYSYSFTIKVQNLSWLPAVLELLLSD